MLLVGPSGVGKTAAVHPGFADVFQVLRLREFSAQEARAALGAVVDLRKRDTKTAVDEHLSDTLVRLFRRFMPYRSLPGATMGFVGQLFDQARDERLTHEVLDVFLASLDEGRLRRISDVPCSP